MNIYRYQFVSQCPANGLYIIFHLEIQTKQMVMVDEIKDFARTLAKQYHEPIADALHEKFGGYQILIAKHHGVEIETRRGAIE